MASDKARIQKTLNATHPFGPKPVLHCFPSDQIEASAIAYEVKRLAASMGDVLNYNDVGILRKFFVDERSHVLLTLPYQCGTMHYLGLLRARFEKRASLHEYWVARGSSREWR